jgi:hypothetical protein
MSGGPDHLADLDQAYALNILRQKVANAAFVATFAQL